jgi:hypothetical protein
MLGSVSTPGAVAVAQSQSREEVIEYLVTTTGVLSNFNVIASMYNAQFPTCTLAISGGCLACLGAGALIIGSVIVGGAYACAGTAGFACAAGYAAGEAAATFVTGALCIDVCGGDGGAPPRPICRVQDGCNPNTQSCECRREDCAGNCRTTTNPTTDEPFCTCPRG